MRILLEILLWGIAIAFLVTIGRGLAPVTGGVARALFSPPVIIGLIAIVLLFRWRKGPRIKSTANSKP